MKKMKKIYGIRCQNTTMDLEYIIELGDDERPTGYVWCAGEFYDLFTILDNHFDKVLPK